MALPNQTWSVLAAKVGEERNQSKEQEAEQRSRTDESFDHELGEFVIEIA